jgi:molybdate transport system substrate-binding protein
MNVPIHIRPRRVLAAILSSAVAFVFGGALLPAASHAATVTVFAAASLKEALDEQTRRFETDTGNKVSVAYGGSNALARQIEAGAPADVFVSADLDWMDYLEQRGLLATGSRVNLLRNELVLIEPATGRTALHIGPNFALAAALGAQKLALANPDSVPAGKYARAALTALGVWSAIERQIVRTENVRATLALVARGEAAFGIVYRTDALADRTVRIVDAFPEATHAPIVYPAALLAPARSPGAKLLLDFLRSTAARGVWQKYGFGVL